MEILLRVSSLCDSPYPFIWLGQRNLGGILMIASLEVGVGTAYKRRPVFGGGVFGKIWRKRYGKNLYEKWEVSKNPKSLTGQFLSGREKIEVPKNRRTIDANLCAMFPFPWLFHWVWHFRWPMIVYFCMRSTISCCSPSQFLSNTNIDSWIAGIDEMSSFISCTPSSWILSLSEACFCISSSELLNRIWLDRCLTNSECSVRSSPIFVDFALNVWPIDFPNCWTETCVLPFYESRPFIPEISTSVRPINYPNRWRSERHWVVSSWPCLANVSPDCHQFASLDFSNAKRFW